MKKRLERNEEIEWAEKGEEDDGEEKVLLPQDSWTLVQIHHEGQAVESLSVHTHFLIRLQRQIMIIIFLISIISLFVCLGRFIYT